MLCFPNCKINIGLYVTRKRADGYHDIETVFYPIAINDILEIVPAKQVQLHATGIPVAGNNADNLVIKAWELMQQEYGEKVKPADIYLHKIIPMGAGLGGGSADGAFMLQLLNDFFSLGISKATLATLALKLGSDCPFFIYNTPMLAKGRGEDMSSISIDLSAYSIQLICPDVHVSTGAAFGMIQPGTPSFHLQHIAQLPLQEWRDAISNDFEQPVFALHPQLAAIKQQLYAQGALYAAMSGSGSALYGIFSKGSKAQINTELTYREFFIK